MAPDFLDLLPTRGGQGREEAFASGCGCCLELSLHLSLGHKWRAMLICSKAGPVQLLLLRGIYQEADRWLDLCFKLALGRPDVVVLRIRKCRTTACPPDCKGLLLAQSRASAVWLSQVRGRECPTLFFVEPSWWDLLYVGSGLMACRFNMLVDSV